MVQALYVSRALIYYKLPIECSLDHMNSEFSYLRELQNARCSMFKGRALPDSSYWYFPYWVFFHYTELTYAIHVGICHAYEHPPCFPASSCALKREVLTVLTAAVDKRWLG